MFRVLSVILPASNEAGYIGPCLAALLASDPVPGGAEVIVVANGCRDNTADRARGFAGQAQAAGWGFAVLELAKSGKTGAMNAGDGQAVGGVRAYLDADVVVGPALMAQLAHALARPLPCYASGQAVIPAARSGLTRSYARFWLTLPFAQSVAPGYGLYAVNAAGRARWGDFPDIISDDTFVRLHFTPAERVDCPAPYLWPMVEGFAALVRVRRRQDAGVAEIARRYPGLMGRMGKARLGVAGVFRRGLRDPAGLAVYALVSLAVRLRRGGRDWTRGR
jgi:glycosyltransferase involved in cell wall biosynthesis